MALAMELPKISGIIPVRCALQYSQGLYLNDTSSVLISLCFVFCCIDFVITWRHLPRNSSQLIETLMYSSSPYPNYAADVAVNNHSRSPIQHQLIQPNIREPSSLPPQLEDEVGDLLSVVTEKPDEDDEYDEEEEAV